MKLRKIDEKLVIYPIGVFTKDKHTICHECYEKSNEKIFDDTGKDYENQEGIIIGNTLFGICVMYKLKDHLCRCRTCGEHLAEVLSHGYKKE